MEATLLKAYVEQNPKRVIRKESLNYPGLFVLKYHREVFYKGLWDDVLEECRGLVVDADYNIVIHPFTKIYNRGENNTDMEHDALVTAVRKVNGFMAAVTVVNGEVIVSTTGSLDSDFVQYAKDKLGDLERFKLQGAYTYIFEIVHEEDPHIVPEEPGAYLIGIRDLKGVAITTTDSRMLNEYQLDVWAQHLGYKRSDWALIRFWEVVERVKTVQHEGYVVRRKGDDYTLKIKSPYYLTLKAIARKKDILSLNKTRVDEEYYDLLDHLLTVEGFNDLEEQDRLEYIRTWLSNRI